MKLIIHILLLTTLAVTLSAQSGDTTLVKKYYEKGKSFYPSQMDSLYHYYELGLTLAHDISDYQGEATLLRSRGVIKGLTGDIADGSKDILAAIDLIKKHGLSAEELVNCHINLGVVYDRSVELEKALEHYIEAEKLAREHGLESKRTTILNNLGIIYRRLEKYEDAVRIYGQALEIRRNNQDSAGMATILLNSSAAYGRIADTLTSLNQAQQAIDIYDQLGLTDEKLFAEANYGHLLSTFGKKNQAIDVLTKVTSSDLSALDPHQQLTTYQSLATALSEDDQYRESENIFDQIEPIIERSEYQEIKRETYLLRAQNNSKLGRYERAYDFLEKHLNLLQKYHQEEKIDARQEMEAKYLTVEKDLKIKLQNAKLKQAKQQRIYFSIGLIGLLILAGLLWRLSQIRKQTNKELDEKNTIISKSLAEKELLLKEIHHRVKNNLQFVSSLLRLQSDYVDDRTALGVLQQGQDRVRSMALIHQNLYQDDNLTGVEVKAYFEKLITGLFQSNNIHDDRIQLLLNISDIRIDVDTIVPIGLITNELITNSLKYAFPDDRQGTITVDFAEREDQLHLRIADDGIGMTDETQEALGQSFGYKMIRAFVGQLEGEMDIQRDQGTAVDIRVNRYEKV